MTAFIVDGAKLNISDISQLSSRWDIWVFLIEKTSCRVSHVEAMAQNNFYYSK